MKSRGRHFAGVTSLVVGICFLLGCAGAPVKPASISRGDYSYTKQYVSWLIEKEMKKNNVTGLSIALVEDQRIIWAQGFGYADEANRIPATPQTVYRAGSISKLFTATAVMQLAEQGKMDIDRPLQDYIPEFSIKTRFPNSGPITLRSIMTHHSGLPSDYKQGMWSKHPEPFTLLAARLKDDYAAYPPNFIFSYSNLGVTLLGHAVQNAANRDFSGYMNDALFKPMNMSLSSFSPGIEMKPFLSKGYRKRKETEEAPLRDLPAGGLQTTVLDLGKFMQMIFAEGKSGDHRILKPETLSEMLRPQNSQIPLDLNDHIGLAWLLRPPEGMDIEETGPVASHGGATILFHSQLMMLPKQKLGVVVLANSSSARSVVDRVAVEALKNAFETKTGIKLQEKKRPSTASVISRNPGLNGYEGMYASIFGPARVTKKSGYLKAETMNKTFFLIPRPDGELAPQYRLFGLIPVTPGDLADISLSYVMLEGHEIVKARRGDHEFIVGEKIYPVAIPESWLKRIGSYKIEDAGDDPIKPDNVQMRSEDGFLFLDYSLSPFSGNIMRFAIKPVSDDEAVIYGLGRGMGETIRAVTVDGREMLVYSGYLAQKKDKK